MLDPIPVNEKLLILPSAQHTVGGTLISLSMIIQGLESYGLSDRITVLVWSCSLLEKYLLSLGYKKYLVSFSASSKREFFNKTLDWVHCQPKSHILLFENCIERKAISAIFFHALRLRLRRTTYFMCRDLGTSHNPFGNLLRFVTFQILRPRVICNSLYTAQHFLRYMLKAESILYPAVDLEKFNANKSSTSVSSEFNAILKLGRKIIFTPSRIKNPGGVNDKNLTALVKVLSILNSTYDNYHYVIMGQDSTINKSASSLLFNYAKELGVSHCFTILPPTFDIENYYKLSDIVVTLAPREPFGRTVIEALACGIPVIGSNTGGIAEILNNFAPHWTVDPTDFEAVSNKICQTLEDPETSSTLRKAKQWISDECSVSAHSKKIIDLVKF